MALKTICSSWEELYEAARTNPGYYHFIPILDVFQKVGAGPEDIIMSNNEVFLVYSGRILVSGIIGEDLLPVYTVYGTESGYPETYKHERPGLIPKLQEGIIKSLFLHS